jgi:triosephosphate isomerase
MRKDSCKKNAKNAEQTEDLLNELIDKIPFETEVQIIVAPTFINLATAVDHLESLVLMLRPKICINQKVEPSQEKYLLICYKTLV